MSTVVTTSKGVRITEGQLFRDAHRTDARTLRVDRITRETYPPDSRVWEARCTVVRQIQSDGSVTEPNKPAKMRLERLGGRDFVQVGGAL
jgi:hypothetical protein